jgi:hypothetical protein
MVRRSILYVPRCIRGGWGDGSGRQCGMSARRSLRVNSDQVRGFPKELNSAPKPGNVPHERKPPTSSRSRRLRLRQPRNPGRPRPLPRLQALHVRRAHRPAEALKASGIKSSPSPTTTSWTRAGPDSPKPASTSRERPALCRHRRHRRRLAARHHEKNGIKVGWLGMTRWLNGNRNPDKDDQPHVNFFPYPGESGGAPGADEARSSKPSKPPAPSATSSSSPSTGASSTPPPRAPKTSTSPTSCWKPAPASSSATTPTSCSPSKPTRPPTTATPSSSIRWATSSPTSPAPTSTASCPTKTANPATR